MVITSSQAILQFNHKTENLLELNDFLHLAHFWLVIIINFSSELQ